MKDRNGTDDPTTQASGGAGEPDKRRHDVLEPESGSRNHPAANIREQQGNSAGGMVPASFTGGTGSADPAAEDHPEDAAGTPNPDAWDSEG